MENFVNILVTNNDLEQVTKSKIASRRLHTVLSSTESFWEFLVHIDSFTKFLKIATFRVFSENIVTNMY